MQIETKPIPGWISAVEAAEELGITKQAIYKMGEARKIQIWTLGNRAMYAVLISDVDKLRESRQAPAG